MAAPNARTVLVVDDEEGVRLVLGLVLEALGCRVATVADAASALATLEAAAFDLVVLDKNLPDRSGLDVLAEVKGRDPDLEVVVVTGYASLEAAVTALRFGAGDFLTKPFEDLDVLSGKLAAALERARRARERTALVARLEARESELERLVSRRTRELEEAVAALKARAAERRRLMVDVAHDLRTPLTTIRGYVDMLHDEGGLSERGARWLEVVRGQCRRLERLTQDVTYLGREVEGHARCKTVEIDTASLFAWASDEVRPLYEQEGVRLRLEVMAGAERLVADRDRLMQLLTNLLGNALKFAPEGSTVRLEAEPDEEAVVLSVADQGPGVPLELRGLIFERWHTRDPSGRGEGIGLSICRRIAENHGGRIWVEDADGGGAVFRVVLPLPPTIAGAPGAA